MVRGNTEANPNPAMVMPNSKLLGPANHIREAIAPVDRTRPACMSEILDVLPMNATEALKDKFVQRLDAGGSRVKWKITRRDQRRHRSQR